jgi:hypothetical protein
MTKKLKRRKNEFMFNREKKASKRVYKVELENKEDKLVRFSGVIEVKYKNCNNKPVLLTDVVVDGDVWVDHVWIELSLEDRKKLLLSKTGTRVYMEGIVGLYVSRRTSMIEKYGLKNVKLVHKE